METTTPEQEPTLSLSKAAKRRQQYRAVSLYCPELKKTRVVMVKRADFNSPEELEAYCAQLRAVNKEKNAAWRKQKRLDGYKARLQLGTTPLTDEAAPPPPTKEIARAVGVTFSPTVDLKLSARTGSTIVIYGSSKRGKSTLMMHLYKKYFKSKESINTLFSGNPHLRVYKGDKRLLVGYGFSDEHAKYVQLQQYINVKTNNHYKFVDLFDDIIDQKHAPIVNKLILTYRNANISLCMCLQYVYLLSKQNRANVNHTFCFGMNSVEDVRGVVELILRPYFVELGFTTLEQQIRFYRDVTADHGFIYLDNINGRISFHRLALK